MKTEFNNNYSNEDGFWSYIYNVFSFLQSDKEINYTHYSTRNESNTNTYFNGKNDDKHRRYIDDKKINKKDWERYFKKKKYPPKCEKESRDIWRKWFCYDDWKDDCEVDDDSDGDES